jgi:hypothetical protein
MRKTKTTERGVFGIPKIYLMKLVLKIGNALGLTTKTSAIN